MRMFAQHQTSTLLRRLAFHMNCAAKTGTADAVHDLRTNIRRLSECLRTFECFLPKGEAERARRKLKKVMDLASEVRNRDVARKLFAKAGLEASDPVIVQLTGERELAKEALVARLKDWSERDFYHRWRGALKL